MGSVILADVTTLTTKKISELTEITTLDRDDILPIVANGATKKIISPNLKKYKFWRSYEPFLDENYANIKGVPTQVNRGLFKGYSMPVWAAHPQTQYEELVFRLRVPFRWDGVTNPYFCAITAISGAEAIGAKYKFQLEWVSKDVGYVLPDTVDEAITWEVTVTDGTAWRAEIIIGEMDGTLLTAGENWQARLRRIASGSPAIVNEPVVFHWCTRWCMDKSGTETAMGY